jgi:hypothetical protein
MTRPDEVGHHKWQHAEKNRHRSILERAPDDEHIHADWRVNEPALAGRSAEIELLRGELAVK